MTVPQVDNPKTLYRLALRREAHQLLAWGYAAAKKGISPDDEETDITGDIVDKIQNLFNDPLLPENYLKYSVQDDRPISSHDRRGKNRQRIDIAIERTGRNRASYSFEAKRLKTSSAPIGKYLGHDGLGCFTSNAYASESTEAAMVGYVLNKSIDYWHKQLTGKLDTALNQITIIDDFPLEWRSLHERKGNTNIQIFHILLDFT